MRKSIYLFLLALCSLTLILRNERFVEMSFAQSQNEPRPLRANAGLDIDEEVGRLLNAERQNPTSPDNVKAKFTDLSNIVLKMLRTGKSAEKVLSREENQSINSMLKSGRYEEASAKVHESILRLEAVLSGSSHNENMRKSPVDLNSRGEMMPRRNFTPDSPIIKVNFNELSNGRFENVLKLLNPVVDSERRRLYVTGSHSTTVGVVDLDRNALIGTFDIGVTGGFLVLDHKTGELYLFQIGREKFYKVDPVTKKVICVESLPPYLSLPSPGTLKTYKEYSYIDSGYPFMVGYLQSGNASYGVIKITDRGNKDVGQILHGPSGLYFDIDPKTGYLYATNTGDTSISVFNLNNGNKKIKDIDIGTSIEEVILNPKTNTLYLRNRLGGSTLMLYNLTTKGLTQIQNENHDPSGIGLWPTQMIFDNERLYVLSHFGSRVDVIDPAAGKIIGKIKIDFSSKPRTDSISVMALDRTRKILYAASPELGEIAVLDAVGLKHLRLIRIKDYDVSRTQTGPANISLAVDDRLSRLFVYVPEERNLFAYNGKSLNLERSITLNLKKAENLLLSNPGKGVLYAGNKILDATTLEERGSYSAGEKVIAFDNPSNRVYLTEAVQSGMARKYEKVYEFENSVLKKEWVMAPVIAIPSTFAFDFANNRFYVGYFESATVEAFDLNSGKAPSASPKGAFEGNRPSHEGKGGSGDHGQSGRCGDGICQPIELKRGVCPEDCK